MFGMESALGLGRVSVCASQVVDERPLGHQTIRTTYNSS